MSPSAKRILPFVGLTVLYWPVALFLLGVSQMGDCYIDGLECEQSRAQTFWWVLVGEAALYALLTYMLVRLRPRH